MKHGNNGKYQKMAGKKDKKKQKRDKKKDKKQDKKKRNTRAPRNAFDMLQYGASKVTECPKCKKSIITVPHSGWTNHWKYSHPEVSPIPPLKKKRWRAYTKPKPRKRVKKEIQTPPNPKPQPQKRRRGSTHHFHPIRWKLKRLDEFKKLKHGQKYKWLKKIELRLLPFIVGKNTKKLGKI